MAVPSQEPPPNRGRGYCSDTESLLLIGSMLRYYVGGGVELIVIIFLQISLKPRSGVLGQLVIFDFETFYLSRALSIHVLSEAERRLMVNMNMGAAQRSRPAKP